MTHDYVRSFDDPDDSVEIEGLQSWIISLGGIVVSRSVHPPGWRWSLHVKPFAKGEWCQTRHMGVAVSGHLRVSLDSGVELDIKAGDVFNIPPGHDGWVIGEVPMETIDWTGAGSWLPTIEDLSDRTLASLVFTDIVDSTATAGRLGETVWGELLATHDLRIKDTIGRHRGRLVKNTGDGVLAMFPGPGRAVRCAVGLREVATGLGLTLRIGVHTGEVEMREGDLHGLVVHEAARIMSAAEPGEVLVSAATRDLMGYLDFELVDRGTHQLRGVSEPQQLFAVIS
jgi:class 3 adenylate cyclase